LVRADEPRSVDVFTSANGKYELRLVELKMILNQLPVQKWSLIEKATKKELYGLTERLASFTVLVSDDGDSLIAVDDFCENEPSAERTVVSFYLHGKLIKQYSMGDLLDAPDYVLHSVSHFWWIAWDSKLQINNGMISFTTWERNNYTLDIRTGEIVGKKFEPPPPLAKTLCGSTSYDIFKSEKDANRISELSFISNGLTKYTIALPSDDDFQGFALDWVKQTPNGFNISIEWGSRFFHEKEFIFVCRSDRFYLEKILHSTFDKANPSKSANTKQKFKVPLASFKITDYMQE
jgi:hypothetical protein